MNMSAEEAQTIVRTLLGKQALTLTAPEVEAVLRETDWYRSRMKAIEDWWDDTRGKVPFDGDL